MKSDGLVILSGLSGTGKSQLVQAYSEALGLPSTNIDFIPVRPYWADDSDLIGYADTVNSVYRPGDSGLVDILVNAEKNQNQLYVIVFDEMNLARVEHYFSQFLSILEMKSESRSIQLYNDELEARMYNKENYPASISIKNNILFVGTINTDESTFQLSDKVLDRSNVIRLNMVPFYENAHEDSNQKSESTN
ncbi:AAA family ATPase, partial [Levilactobacillus brevis]|nr:AAA family ATPase [Levilactobacillus brevis]